MTKNEAEVISSLGHAQFGKSRFATKQDWSEHPRGVFTCARCGDSSYSIALGDLQSLEQRSAQFELPEAWFEKVPFWVSAPSFHFVFPCPACGSKIAAYVRVRDTRFGGTEYEIQWVQTGKPSVDS